MFKHVTILANTLFFCITVLCQQKDVDFKFGNVTAKDFDVSSSKIVDSSDAAVILYEAGSTYFAGNNNSWFSYVYTCTKRIKIINKNAFDLATIELSLYSKDDEAEALSEIKAVTYNLENGKVSSSAIDENDVFSETEDENHITKKFTLPGVKEGSIIEYSYTKTSPYLFNLPSWQFQDSHYPVLWSEYKVSIPATLTYTSIKQGLDSFYINKSWIGKESYKINQKAPLEDAYTIAMKWYVDATTINHRWADKNVKPLSIESYISSPVNYVDKIEFQLAKTYNGEDTAKIINTWNSASQYFAEKKDFIQALSGDNSWIKDVPAASSNFADLDIAKNIFYFIQTNYTCTNFDNIDKYTDLYDLYRKQNGTVRGINLLLIAMLKNKGIYAEPVILSTKPNGFVNPYYPVIDKFNYIICRTLIDGKAYLLDASNPVLGFGQLSTDCYNGYARIINEHRSDSLYLFSDSLINSEITTLTLNNSDNGQISGTYKYISGKNSSADMRKKMATTKVADYFKDLKNEYPFNVNMNNTSMDSLNQREMPVSIQYDIDFKLSDDIVYFNPVAPNDIQKENPFKAALRLYPVEMPYCLEKTYVLNMQVPAGYTVDELPKSARISLNGNDGTFQYLIQHNGDNIQLMCRLKLNKATFEPEDYETLRNFFAFIVEKESEQIVFKKQ